MHILAKQLLQEKSVLCLHLGHYVFCIEIFYVCYGNAQASRQTLRLLKLDAQTSKLQNKEKDPNLNCNVKGVLS